MSGYRIASPRMSGYRIASPRMRGRLRSRLAVFYGGVFFVSGSVLLGFVLVAFWGGRSTRSTVEVGTAPVPGTLGAAAAGSGQSDVGLRYLLVSSLIGLVVMVVVSVVLGWVIAGRSLRPLHAMMTSARAISAGNLRSRIGLESPYEEFQELGATFDDLFERLDAAFTAQRHFVANAAHELRTPLTAERALLQVALADPDANADTLRAACEEVLALGAAQEHLVESLLTLAGGEQGLAEREPFDLGAITEHAVRQRRPEAARRDVHLETSLAKARSTGDPRLVESLVANLLDNAIRHNVPGGRVEVRTSTSTGISSLTVANTGPVIPPEEVDRLFTPFQRLRRERVRHQEGHGLGLAIVRAIADAHGATVTASAPAGGGLLVQVDFSGR